jgi:diguanylate cyclase (GGDEF)-like protein
LTHIAEEDTLTGLPNRLSFETRFEHDWKTAARESAALSMIMVDLDGFKVANDEYGHGYGDLVLQRIAQLITASLRMKSDFAARLGGDEFVVLLPSTTNTAAVQIAERLRHLVEKSNISSPGSSTPQALGSRLVTVCCGVATASPTSVEEKRQHLLEAADKALYQAKREGRNCVRS